VVRVRKESRLKCSACLGHFRGIGVGKRNIGLRSVRGSLLEGKTKFRLKTRARKDNVSKVGGQD